MTITSRTSQLFAQPAAQEPARRQSPSRLAVLCDYPEEGWPSMDLCSEMLLSHVARDCGDWDAERICPRFRRVVGRFPYAGRSSAALNADRFINRFVVYPRSVRRIADRFDVFHIVDHSYAYLINWLPTERTGVYCHDLDAFRCLLKPQEERRPRWFRAMARRILMGFQKAAIVFHNSRQTGDQLVRAGIVDPAKLVHAPLGTAPEFQFDPNTTEPCLPWLDEFGHRPWLLHVGSCIDRKRLDVLLDMLAALRKRIPDVRLVKVGGDWSPDHVRHIERDGLSRSITHVKNLSRAELAVLYRRANAVLVPSETEGFGLPVIEALACGGMVVASDIPVLREVGGPVSVFCPVADVAAWTETVLKVLTDPGAASSRPARLAWAKQFTWQAHADIISTAYRRLLHDVNAIA